MSRGTSHARMTKMVHRSRLLWPKDAWCSQYVDVQAATSAFPGVCQREGVCQAAPLQAVQPLMQRTRTPREDFGGGQEWKNSSHLLNPMLSPFTPYPGQPAPTHALTRTKHKNMQTGKVLPCQVLCCLSD